MGPSSAVVESRPNDVIGGLTEERRQEHEDIRSKVIIQFDYI